MSRFHCPACGSTHYDGYECEVTHTTVNHYEHNLGDGYREHCYCGENVCHPFTAHRYANGDSADCGPHCLSSTGHGANASYWRNGGRWPVGGSQAGKPATSAVPLRDAGGYCSLCGGRHDASAHGDFWWVEQSRGTAGTPDAVDAALAALRAKLSGDETPA